MGTDGCIWWEPKGALHDILGKTLCKNSTTFSLQIGGIEKGWDYVLWDSYQPVYLSVPADPVIIPQVFVKKLQLCDWLVAKLINKTPDIISIAWFTNISTADRTALKNKLELVNMDEALGQAVRHCNDIGCNLTNSYMIASVHAAVITMLSLLAFLLNLANWTVAEDNIGQEKPALCHFLKRVIDLYSPEWDRRGSWSSKSISM